MVDNPKHEDRQSWKGAWRATFIGALLGVSAAFIVDEQTVPPEMRAPKEPLVVWRYRRYSSLAKNRVYVYDASPWALLPAIGAGLGLAAQLVRNNSNRDDS